MAHTPARDEELSGTPADDATQIMAFHCPRCGAQYEGSDACPLCGTLRTHAECEEHPGTPAEGRCVICGKLVCGSCRPTDTDPYVCAEDSGIPISEGWAQVYSTTSEVEAQLLRENLQAEGITATIISQKDHNFPVGLGELAIVRIMVPVWQYGGALEVIRGHMDAEGEVLFACPACGEAYEPGSTACASCGAPLAGS